MLIWININIGKKILAFRKEKDLTQEELGKALNLSRTSIANFEAGTQAVSIVDLYKIALETDKDIIDFLPDTKDVKTFVEMEPTEKIQEDNTLSPDAKFTLTSFIKSIQKENENN